VNRLGIARAGWAVVALVAAVLGISVALLISRNPPPAVARPAALPCVLLIVCPPTPPPTTA